MKCQRCGLPQVDGAMGYTGPQCKCWVFYNPAPNGAYVPPAIAMTEAEVRRIVREEIARITEAPTKGGAA